MIQTMVTVAPKNDTRSTGRSLISLIGDVALVDAAGAKTYLTRALPYVRY